MSAVLSASPAASAPAPWKVLIVDDEPGLHDVTKLVLKRLKFDGRPLQIMSAHSAQEARDYIENQRDIAVALVDVVMENDQAGLDLVRDIRDRYAMPLTRIILRTGNPGNAPEREVIEHFEIDDYRDKTELTSDRLFTAVYTGLRAYQTLLILEETASGLERIIKSAARASEQISLTDFAADLMRQMENVAGAAHPDLLFADAFMVADQGAGPAVIHGKASHQGQPFTSLDQIIPAEISAELQNALNNPIFHVSDAGLLFSLRSPTDQHLAVWVPAARPPARHAMRLLRVFIEKFQLNIDNARLHEEILEAQRTALSKLCEAVEMRSKETGQHIYRMAKYSKLLAQLAGLNREQVALIEAAAPLHDIGKVAIPDAVLKKAGSLDADEIEIMRSHAHSGWELLHESKSEMLQLGAQIALTHHERWDGKGYPRGLKAQEIPIEGRIVSLSDVFDALMSKRVYKEAFSFEKTMGIIAEGSGTFFDPQLVDLMVAHGDQFHQIFLANPDRA